MIQYAIIHFYSIHLTTEHQITTDVTTVSELIKSHRALSLLNIVVRYHHTVQYALYTNYSHCH